MLLRLHLPESGGLEPANRAGEGVTQAGRGGSGGRPGPDSLRARLVAVSQGRSGLIDLSCANTTTGSNNYGS